LPVYAASVVAFLIAAALLLALRPLAKSIGLLDRPGGHKTHSGNVPVIGGIAMLGGLLLAAVLGGGLGHHGNVVLIAALFMVLIGALDDRFNLAPQFRLFAHAGAAIALVYGTNFVVPDLGDLLGLGIVELSWASLPFTVVACIALINAFNMLDGLDGLAGGCGLIAFAGLSAVATARGDAATAMLSASMLGASLGFLVFNLPARFNRGVRTFMGDAGSTLLGFLLASIGLILVQPTRADISPVLILWMMPIPIFELFATTGRRLLRGRSPVRADDGHFHNHFLRAGFSVRLVFCLYVVVSVLSAWAGIAGLEAGLTEPLLFGLFVGLFMAWLALARFAPAIGSRLPMRLRRHVENLPI
jgi:UDP-GlcNAc:undecaprenyl-phosphate GlcNAc-1-phosphate transferase